MKKILLLTCLLGITCLAFSQAKKPTIMVVPSDNWCVENGFTQTFNNQGKKMVLPDYKAALQGNSDLLLVIAKINELMAERDFPLKNLESALKSLESQSAEDAMLSSSTGASLSESPIDILKKTAKADIWMQVTWSVISRGPEKQVTFILQGLDAYTDKQIAGASGTGKPSFSAALPILLTEAVISHLDNFNAQLQKHFDDMFKNGREVILRVRVWDSWGYNFESEDFGGKELGVVIEDWVSDNTVQHRFNTSEATENMLLFEQVRIPLYDEKNKAVDTRGWARGLQKYLKDTYQIDAKLMMKGLGQAQLVLGEK